MKKYTLKLYVTFIIIQVFVFMGGTLFYLWFSNLYVVDTLKNDTNRITETINQSMKSMIVDDYAYFLTISNNDLTDLTQNKSSFVSTRGLTFEHFGKITNNKITIDDAEYTLNQNYVLKSDYYDQGFTIYSLNEIIDNYPSSKFYGVFKHENLVGLFDIESYVEPFVKMHDKTHDFMMISSDNYIYYPQTNNHKYLYNYLRNTSSFIVDGKFLNNEPQTIKVFTLNGEELFLSSLPIVIDGVTTIYGVMTFKYDDLYRQYGTLILIMALIMLLILLTFSIAIYFSQRLIYIKNSDIENAKLTYFYVKSPIIQVNSDGKITRVNKAFKDRVPDYKKYKTINDLSFNANIEARDIMRNIERQQPINALFTNDEKEVVLRFLPIRSSRGFELIGEDITARDLSFQTYRGIALYHQTTNLPNINHLQQDLETDIKEKIYLKRSLSVLALDIINFKNINQLLGVDTADFVLVNVSKLILDYVKNMKSTVYNVQKDQFIVTIADFTEDQLRKFVDELMDSFEKPLEIEKSKLVIELRAGIYYLQAVDESLTFDDIYDRTIQSLDYAKQVKKKIVYYDSNVDLMTASRKQMAVDLQNAILNDEFTMYLQPQYDIYKERIVSFEALIRWENEKYKNNSPSEFIQLAESNNMIIDIGRIVIDKTLKIAKQLEKYNIKLSLNVSPAQMLQAGFISEFMDKLQTYDVEPNGIAIEITETFLMSSFDVIVEKIKILKNAGIDIHLDDFGTGYSSLQYLQELPFDAIKIDRAFVMHLPNDKYSKAIIGMITTLAKNLNVEVIAEGVETKEQYQFLYKANCSIIQGYLLSKAVNMDDAIQLLKKYNENKEPLYTDEIKKKRGGR